MKPYIVTPRNVRIVKKPIREPEFGANRSEFETYIFNRASYFTVCKKKPMVTGQFPEWKVTKFTSFRDAVLIAECDPRALLYAVSEADYNLSVPIARKDWVRYLKKAEDRVSKEP